MIRAAAIGLVAAMFLQLALVSAIIVRYEVNRAEITEAFCVNKEKPELKCQGSCHVSKQLRQQFPVNTDLPAELLELSFAFLACVHLKSEYFDVDSASAVRFYNRTAQISAGVHDGVFHPPRPRSCS